MNLLRPTDASPLRLIRYARPLAEATHSQWAMHIHSPGQYIYDGRCLPYAGRPASTATQSSRTISLRPTDASPLRLIRCARPLAQAVRSECAMPSLESVPPSFMAHVRAEHACVSVRAIGRQACLTPSLRDAFPVSTPVRWPGRYVYNGRCTSIRRGNTFTMGDASLKPDGPPLPRSCHPSDEFASSDGSIAPTPGSLRPRVGRVDTFTMGDAHPSADATRSPRAMPPLNRTARLCRGPVIPV